MFVLGKPFQPSLMFAGKSGAYLSDAFSGAPLKGRFLAPPTLFPPGKPFHSCLMFPSKAECNFVLKFMGRYSQNFFPLQFTKETMFLPGKPFHTGLMFPRKTKCNYVSNFYSSNQKTFFLCNLQMGQMRQC